MVLYKTLHFYTSKDILSNRKGNNTSVLQPMSSTLEKVDLPKFIRYINCTQYQIVYIWTDFVYVF